MIFVASSTQLSSYGHSAVCSHPLHQQHVRYLELKLELKLELTRAKPDPGVTIQSWCHVWVRRPAGAAAQPPARGAQPRPHPGRGGHRILGKY